MMSHRRRLRQILLTAILTTSGTVLHGMVQPKVASALDITVTSFSELQTALNTVNATPGEDHTITVNITLSDHLPVIKLDTNRLKIVGGIPNNRTDTVVSGNNEFRILFVEKGTVNVSNLTLVDGRAKGGDGGSTQTGGGGGMGAGGAIFVDKSAAVSLTNVHLTSNDAVGGLGGSVVSGSEGFGSGGGGGLGGDLQEWLARAIPLPTVPVEVVVSTETADPRQPSCEKRTLTSHLGQITVEAVVVSSATVDRQWIYLPITAAAVVAS
jgi:hypothetical protein